MDGVNAGRERADVYAPVGEFPDEQYQLPRGRVQAQGSYRLIRLYEEEIGRGVRKHADLEGLFTCLYGRGNGEHVVGLEALAPVNGFGAAENKGFAQGAANGNGAILSGIACGRKHAAAHLYLCLKRETGQQDIPGEEWFAKK